MPLPTPFHARTAPLCESHLWKDWAGHVAVRRFDTHHEAEYFAIRHAVGLQDVSPLHKVRVHGPGARDFLAWVTARDVTRLRVGRVAYGCWCDEHGKVLDDGTITRWDDDDFRVTSADPSYGWLVRHARGFDVSIDDDGPTLGALALQGPRARDVLVAACDGGDVASLRFFRATRSVIAGVGVDITRTGYTGDLGYEIWMPAEGAVPVWDALVEAGRPHGLLPTGLDALDMVRLEAAFVLMGVDYFSARTCLVPSQTSTPDEIGLGWTVHLDREPFVGQAALAAERARGRAWGLVGLAYEWDAYEALFDAFGLPPQVPSGAWRTAVPVYGHGHQVGQATSGTWSPLLKRNIALASVRTPHDAVGTRLEVEVTVEFERRLVPARVVERPFFDPERKRR